MPVVAYASGVVKFREAQKCKFVMQILERWLGFLALLFNEAACLYLNRTGIFISWLVNTIVGYHT